MTVYVDSCRVPAVIDDVNARWSHLTADTEAELHEFAQLIGLRRERYRTGKRQCASVGGHYDVTDMKRTRALRAGAVRVAMREFGDRRGATTRVWSR